MKYLKLKENIHLFYQPLERQTVSVELVYSAGGSWFEKPTDSGKKHLLEHCIASRTKDMDFEAFKSYQFEHNLNLNAYTGPLTMGLTAKGHKDDLDKMLGTILEMAFNPTFDQQILTQEKEIVLKEISERRGEPSYRLYFETQKDAFENGSYARHEVLGNPKMVAQTTLEDLYRLNAENLKQSQIIINLAGGGIDLENLKAKIDSIISPDFFENPKLELPIVVKNTWKAGNYFTTVSDIAHSEAEVAVMYPLTITKENIATINIFNQLFVSYYGGLYDLLRNKLQLVYGISASKDKDTQIYTISFTSQTDKVEEIYDHIENFWSKFKFDEIMFGQLKNNLIKKSQMAMDTLGFTCDFMQEQMEAFGEVVSYEDYVAKLTAVTKQDIAKMYEEIASGSPKISVISNNPIIKNFFR